MGKKKTFGNTSKALTYKRLGYKIQDVRKIINDRMKELDLTPYAVGKLVGSGMTEQTVRNYVTHGKSMRSDKLERLLAVLGLEVRAKK